LCLVVIGALIGLDLVARHPEQVRILVAHEPPAWELLSNAERDHAMRAQEDADDTFLGKGAEAAFKKFVRLAAVDYNDRKPAAVLAPPTSQTEVNLSFFFKYDSPAVRRYASTSRRSRRRRPESCPPVDGRPGSAPYRTAAALAAKFGEAFVEFPGGHTGWLLRPKGFAAKLPEVLR
jgi:pimeloyl-ACP methyl ester carboxylesterase